MTLVIQTNDAVSLALPALPNGYSWNIAEASQAGTDEKALVVELWKTVGFSKFDRIFHRKRVLTGETKQKYVSSTMFGLLSDDYSLEDSLKRFTEIATKLYDEEFNVSAHNQSSVYVGTYTE